MMILIKVILFLTKLHRSFSLALQVAGRLGSSRVHFFEFVVASMMGFVSLAFVLAQEGQAARKLLVI